MDVQILTKKENPLLHRTEVRFKAVHKAEPTPTRDALRAFLARELKAHKENVVVDRAQSTFGRYETLGYAKVYKSKEQALAIERHHILVRNQLAAREAKAEKPAEAAPAPKVEKAPPAKKEEAKPEAKPAAKAEPKPEKAPAKEEKKPAPEKAAAEKKEAKKPEAKKAAPKKKEEK